MPLQALFVVRSGSFKTYSTSEHGEAQIIGFHLPGEILGFDGVGNDRHECTAEALERSTVCEVPFNRLTQIASQVPDLQRQLMRVVSREVLRDHEHLVMMGRRHAQERLAIFLKSLSERNQRLKRNPLVLTLTMSRYELREPAVHPLPAARRARSASQDGAYRRLPEARRTDGRVE
jgi:CRP/FNR family transcriptional regulator